MTAVFADTFYWIALTNVQDLAHEKAKSFTRSTTPAKICTTEEVLIEYLNYFAAWGLRFRQQAAINVQNMVDSDTVQIIPQTTISFREGLSLYRARLDKGYSLTDGVSMQTMRDERISDVLTSDAHFEQEGFRALLRS
jgi:predicted nucleic acid-binding protein